MSLDARKKKVLMAIVQDYIATAEPVGSRTIARKYNLGVSSATIRNEMADLEELGYIEQPHTSAGRIPSDRGYRYYVNHLMKREEFNSEETKLVLNGYLTKKQEIGSVLRSAGQLLSQITNYAGVVVATSAGLGGRKFKHIQLVHMGGGQSMVVMVTDAGVVHHQIIDIPESILISDLDTISSVLNHKLQGKTVESIRLTLIQEIYLELAKQKNILDMAMEVIQEGLKADTKDKIYLGGIFNILSQPEFHNIERVKILLGLLENEHELAIIMSDIFPNEGVSVRIGKELENSRMKDYSLVMGAYHMEGKFMGRIGLLGPTRMDYAKAFAVVEYMTDNISLIIERLMRWRSK